MRPAIVEWMAARGLPGWVVPQYWILAGLAALLGMMLTFRFTRRDGASVRAAAVAMAGGYVGAIAGGFVFESLRHLPDAIAAGSPMPMILVGRAAYGGLLFGLLAAVVALRWSGEPAAAFLDRVSPALGIGFAFVRTGCFLGGCDYGVPSAFALAVRFPPGSAAALDHASRGWIPAGAASLPVHPTQLYEAALGLLAGVVALAILRSARRDGTAFRAWMTTYAIGRFTIECLRGDDAARGLYGGLSTAQYVSLGILAVLITWTAFRHLRPAPSPPVIPVDNPAPLAGIS